MRALRVSWPLLFAIAIFSVVPWNRASSAPPLESVAAPLEPTPARPSIQEIMQTTVDRAADGVWDAVGTIITKDGIELRRPRSPAEWAAVRSAAVTLVLSARLLMIDGRAVAIGGFRAEAKGALNSTQIQRLIAQQRPAFDAFAAALRDAAATAIAAIDAQDTEALTRAGGAIEEVCEACHLAFWYPHQVIPAFPRDHDPHRPITEIGAPLNRGTRSRTRAQAQVPAFLAPGAFLSVQPWQ
jgi:cytochrome c556